MLEQEIREIYNQETSKLKPPPSLVSSTLEKMHAEFQRMENEKNTTIPFSAPSAKKSKKPLYLWGAAVAAALIIATASVTQMPKLTTNTFIYKPDTRLDMIMKAPNVETQENVTAPLPQTIGNFTLQTQSTNNFAMNQDAPSLTVTQATYEDKEKHSAIVTISNFETILYQTLSQKKDTKLAGQSFFLGRDENSKSLYAVFMKGKECVQVSFSDEAHWNNSNIQQFLEDIVREQS